MSAGHKRLKVEAIANSKPKIKFVSPILKRPRPLSFEVMDSNTLTGIQIQNVESDADALRLEAGCLADHLD
jgi:hypothetical protein